MCLAKDLDTATDQLAVDGEHIVAGMGGVCILLAALMPFIARPGSQVLAAVTFAVIGLPLIAPVFFFKRR